MQVLEVKMQVLGSNNVDRRRGWCRSLEVIMQVPEVIFCGRNWCRRKRNTFWENVSKQHNIWAQLYFVTNFISEWTLFLMGVGTIGVGIKDILKGGDIAHTLLMKGAIGVRTPHKIERNTHKTPNRLPVKFEIFGVFSSCKRLRCFDGSILQA